MQEDSHLQQADHDDKDVEDQSERTPVSTATDPATAILSLSHADVSNAPEDESEERVEKGAHESQQIPKERNNLGDYTTEALALRWLTRLESGWSKAFGASCLSGMALLYDQRHRSNLQGNCPSDCKNRRPC